MNEKKLYFFWAPTFSGTVQSKTLYLAFWNREIITTTFQHKVDQLEQAVCTLWGVHSEGTRIKTSSSGLLVWSFVLSSKPFWFLRFLVLFQGVALCLFFFLPSSFSFQVSSLPPLIQASKKFRLWSSNHLKCLHWNCWKPLLSFPQNQCYFKKEKWKSVLYVMSQLLTFFSLIICL